MCTRSLVKFSLIELARERRRGEFMLLAMLLAFH